MLVGVLALGSTTAVAACATGENPEATAIIDGDGVANQNQRPDASEPAAELRDGGREPRGDASLRDAEPENPDDDAGASADGASRDASDGTPDGASDGAASTDSGTDGGSVADVPTLTLVDREGAVASIRTAFVRERTLPRLSVNSCRGSSLRFTVAAPYVYVRIQNPNRSRDAEVSVWTERASGGPVLDTVIAAYERASVPTTETERLGCTVGVEQSCRATGGYSGACRNEGGVTWAGLMRGDARSVRVPAGGSALVYVAAYRADEFGEFVVAGAIDAFR